MSSPEELLQRAQKKGVPTSGFMKIFGGDSSYKYEEAADLCIQAANLYKLRKELKAAGDAFVKAAQFQLKAGNDDDAGNVFVDAYKSYKAGSDSQLAIDSLKQAIELFTKKGQFRRSANFKFELGEIYETDLHDYTNAISEFETAGEWYSQDQAMALANKSWLKCADLLALNGEYIKASDHYSKLISNSIGNKLSQWSLKDYYLKKALCQLAATDSVAANRTLQEAMVEDNNFADSREAKLLSDLISAYGENDTEKLSATAFEFDKFSKLDKWKTTILLKIKETISEAEDDLL
ncbi:alpha-soluble NSF attachment protein [Monosporozyma servazzii]